MSVWLTSERKPFYGGSYFPARDGDRGTNMGFLTLLKKLNESFHQPDSKVNYAGQQITAAIQKMLSSLPGDHLPKKDILDNAAIFYRQSYDNRYGGLVGAPKFPSSLPVRFLLRYYRQTGDKDILEMVRHLGGGFHRYSTDEQWLVPHFEKMLYDNALLATAYLEAYQVTKNADFKRIVKQILRYVERDMTSQGGGFYSATDADSLTPDGHMDEGYYFTWTPEELVRVLGEDRAGIVKAYYSVGPKSNFEGRHILHIDKPIYEMAALLNMPEMDLTTTIQAANENLYQARNLRPAPLRDEKILTAWNALMISAYARAGLIFGKPGYINQAERAAQFIMDHLYKNHRLYRSYKDNVARHNAYLDDYAFLIAGLMDLYEATHNIVWFEKALELDDVLKKFYEDKDAGGFFMTSTDHENLIAREKPYYDSAIPSGNAVAVLNLLRFYSFTTDYRYKERAEKALKTFSERLSATPSAMSDMLTAIDYYLVFER